MGEDPFIRNLNEFIKVLQNLVAEHPKAGNVGVQVRVHMPEQAVQNLDFSVLQQLANHCVGFKTQIEYHPTGSSGYERSGCIIIRGGE
mgnify:CR=1 FL=1